MLANLLQLVKENAGEAIINNAAIPNERNEEAISETANGMMDFFKQNVSSGNIQSIMGMFQNGGNSQMIANLSQTIAGNLGNKFGLSAAQSSAIVQQLIPVVIDKFISKTNDPTDKSFDLQDIVSTIGGGANEGGLLGKLGGLFGK